MTELPANQLDSLVAELLAHSTDERAAWLTAHPAELNLGLIAAFKQRSDALLISDPRLADQLTHCALLIAQHVPSDVAGRALADWGRGNWEAYHEPAAAIQSYLRAVAVYRTAGDMLAVARILSNLVFAYCDCGRFAEAQQAYHEASVSLLAMGEAAAVYLLRLEQNYGWLLHNQGQYEQALVAHARALALARQLDQPVVAAEVQVNRALTLGMLGRLDDGEAALLEERAVAEQNEQALTVARIDLNLGELYTAQGRPADALRRFGAARKQFVALDNPMELGTALICEATLFERIGALRDARRSYARAQQHFTALDMLPMVGETLVRGAAVSRHAGDFAQAQRLLNQAEAFWETLEQPHWRALVRFERIALALAQEDVTTAFQLLGQPLSLAGTPALAARRDILLAEARAQCWRSSGSTSLRNAAWRAFDRTLRYAQRVGDRWLERQALAGLGLLVLPDDPAAGCAYFEAAVTLDETTRQTLTVEELKASFFTETNDLLPLLARLAVEQGHSLDALHYAWRAKGGALLELLDAKEVTRAPQPNDAEIDQLRQELAAQRWEAALQRTDLPDSGRERESPAIRALERRLYELRRARNHFIVGQGDMLRYDPARLLRDMNADLLIEYFAYGDSLFALRADPAGVCRAAVLGETNTILDLLDELQLNFQNVLAQPAEPHADSSATWLDECLPLLQRCYELLLAPLGDLPNGARLLIAPCAPLYLVPFSACWDGAHYLVERCDIQMTPCGALLATPTHGATITGEPLIIAATAAGQLAGVSAEAEVVRAALPGSICQIDQAGSIGYLRDLPAAPRLLHIAAHSILRSDAPIFSALQLTGGMLSVEECYELPLAGTQLVTLSSCATSTGLDSGGAVLAFQSALFVAGAQQVLSSLWPIDDQATVSWMGRFYQFLSAGVPAASAVRKTQQALLASAAYHHPAFWAAFACSRR